MTSTSASGPACFNTLEESGRHSRNSRRRVPSTAWARQTLAARPFATPEDLYTASDAPPWPS